MAPSLPVEMSMEGPTDERSSALWCTGKLVCRAWLEGDHLTLDDTLVFCVTVVNTGEETVLASASLLAAGHPNTLYLTMPCGQMVGLPSAGTPFVAPTSVRDRFRPFDPQGVTGVVYRLSLPLLARAWAGERVLPLFDPQDPTSWTDRPPRERFGDLCPGQYSLHAVLCAADEGDGEVMEYWGVEPWSGRLVSNHVPFTIEEHTGEGLAWL